MYNDGDMVEIMDGDERFTAVIIEQVDFKEELSVADVLYTVLVSYPDHQTEVSIYETDIVSLCHSPTLEGCMLELKDV